MMHHPLPSSSVRGLLKSYAAQQTTEQQYSISASLPEPAPTEPPAITDSSAVLDQPTAVLEPAGGRKRKKITRFIALLIVAALAFALFFIWQTMPAGNTGGGISQQNFSPSTVSTSVGTNTSTSNGGHIQVYIVGAVRHPGVYTMDISARVYQLLQMAGGPLPDANLVALNMAAKLSDGQEVYVPKEGETPPAYVGGVPAPGASGTVTTSGDSPTTSGSRSTTAGSVSTTLPVNINTASTEDLHLALRVTNTTAQHIIDYRAQHGPYTSVEQLLQVVSKSTYNRIKGMVTV
jgi:competence protein ComEA